MARIDTLVNFLTDVASAIKDKKGDTTAIKASDFDTEIANLPGGKYAPRNMGRAWQNCQATELDYEVENLDISNLTSLEFFFAGMSKLTHIDTSNFINDNKITSVWGLFDSCGSLDGTIDLSGVTSDIIADWRNTFYNCAKVKRIDIRNLSSGENTYSLLNTFKYLRQLQYLNISSMDLTKATNVFGAFDYIPNGCEIIVKDDASKQILLSNYTSLTNVKTKDEV